jgi:hypothetical protein
MDRIKHLLLIVVSLIFFVSCATESINTRALKAKGKYMLTCKVPDGRVKKYKPERYVAKRDYRLKPIFSWNRNKRNEIKRLPLPVSQIGLQEPAPERIVKIEMPLVKVTYQEPQIRHLSSSPDADVRVLEWESGQRTISDEVFEYAHAISTPIAISENTPMKDPEKNGDINLILIFLSGLIPFSALFVFKPAAYNISFWSAMNPWKTRLMLAGVHLGLGCGGILLGKAFFNNGIDFTELPKFLMLGTFISSSVIYPFRNHILKFVPDPFIRQKSLDLAMVMSSFLLLVNAGNDPEFTNNMTKRLGLKEDIERIESSSQRQAQLTKLVYFQDQDINNTIQDKTANERTKGEKITITILASILGLLLTFAVVAGTCGLICSGMGGLAAVVGVGGGALVIWIMSAILESIWHPERRKMRKAERTKKRIIQA